MSNELALGIRVEASGIPEASSSFSQFAEVFSRIEQNTGKTVSAIESFGKSSESARETTNALTSSIFNMNQAWELASKAFDLVKSGIGAVVGTFSEFAQTSNTFEQLGVKFESVFGGQGPAQKALDWAAKFGAETPMTLEEVTNRMIKLKTYGFDPLDESQGMMKKIGDAAYALGTDFDGIVSALGQMQLKGKVSAEELMQLSERNIPAFEILREKFKLSAKDMENIGNAGIPVKDAIDSIVESIGDRFQGAMKKASDTAQGSWSTIEDTWTLTKKAIMDSGPWDFVVEKSREIRDSFSSLFEDSGFQDTLKGIGGTVRGTLDLIWDAGEELLAKFSENFGGISETIKGFFSDGGASAKEVFKVITSGFGLVLEAFGSTWNAIIDVIQAANFGNWFTGLVSLVAEGLDNIQGFVATLIEALAGQLSDFTVGIGEEISQMVRDWPNLADALGIDQSMADEIVSFGQGIGDVGKVVVDASDGISKFAEKTNNWLGSANQNMESWKINLQDVEQAHIKINQAIENTSFEPIQKQIEVKPDTEKIKKDFAEAGKSSAESFASGLKSIDQSAISGEIKSLFNSLVDFSGTKEAFDKQVREIEKSFKSMKEESQKAREEELEETVKQAEKLYGPKSDQVKKVKELKREELESSKEYWSQATDAFKESLEDQKEKFKNHVNDEKKLRDEALDHMKKNQESEREELDKTLKAAKRSLEERQTQEDRDFKRQQELQKQQFEAANKGAPDYDKRLAAFKQFQDDQQFAFDQDQKRKKQAFEDEAEARKQSLKTQQEATTEAFKKSGEAVDGLTDKTKSAAATMAQAFKTNMTNMPQTLSDSFKSVNDLSKEYLDLLKDDPWSNASDRTNKARQLLDDQKKIQEKLVSALEKLADRATKGAKVNVTVDGVENAITELLKQLLERAFIQAESEGTYVSAP